MKKSEVDNLETIPVGGLLELILETIFPSLEEELDNPQELKKKRKERKTSVKKDSPKPEPEISKEEAETDGRRRRRRKRNKAWGAVSTDIQDFNPLEGRRTRRGEKSRLEVEKKIEPKIIPYPLPEREAEINQLAQEIANQTAQKFLDCIPPEIKEVLSEEQLKYQQYELSAGIAEAVRSKLEWAMNQAWLDAKKNNESNSVD